MSVILVLLFFVVQYSTCQVCNITKSIVREVPEAYLYSFIESYEEPCLIFCSVKTRTGVKDGIRMVQKCENVTVYVCCDGYIEDYYHEGDGLYCKPVCDPDCQNGYCRRPNECACNAGYGFDPIDPHVCKPLCLEGCDIPDCLTTSNSQCYSNVTDQPNSESSESLATTTFVGLEVPEVCQCPLEYYNTSENINNLQTVPEVYNSCHFGGCECGDGWKLKPATCQPLCSGCEFGTCVSPQECECNYGYTKTKNGNCEPFCSTGCPNGKCVSPEVCTCNPRWYMINDGGECYPHCDVHCVNGDCVAPNVCVCQIGYHLDRNKEDPKCVPIRKDCERPNLVPEDCKCEYSYEVNYSTDDGSDCDCFASNCSKLERKCTKSFCVFKKDYVVKTPVEVEEDAVNLPEVNLISLLNQSDFIINHSNTEEKDPDEKDLNPRIA